MVININEMIEKMTPDAFFRYALLVGAKITDIHMSGYRNNCQYRTFDGNSKLNIAAITWLYALMYNNEKHAHLNDSYPFLFDPDDPIDSGTVHFDGDIFRVNFDTFKNIINEVYGAEATCAIIKLAREGRAERVEFWKLHHED